MSYSLCKSRKKIMKEFVEEPALKGILIGKTIDVDFEKKMCNMFHVAYYVAKKERPFTDFTDLVDLKECTGSKLPHCYRSDKAVARFLVDIHEEECQSFLDELSKSRFISLQVDGATDNGNLEDEIVYVKFLSQEDGPTQHFLEIHDVKNADATGVLHSVDRVLKLAGVEQWKDQVVFLCADVAVVHMGKNNGLASKLKSEIGHLLAVHCVAHRLELGISKAIKNHPMLQKLNDSNMYEGTTLVWGGGQ